MDLEFKLIEIPMAKSEINYSKMTVEQLLSLAREKIVETEKAIHKTDSLISDIEEYKTFAETYLKKDGSKTDKDCIKQTPL